jgi:hypothetical protein
MTSPDFARFYFSFFEDTDSARQGLDLAALAGLVGEERADAEDMLLRRLPDARSVIGLGVLRSRKAEAELLALFKAESRTLHNSGGASSDDWQPYALINLARALSQIRPNPLWSDAIIDILKSGSDALHRQRAAEALVNISEAAVEPALIAALDDRDALVRYHAGKALLTSRGVPIDIQDPNSMLSQLMSQDASRRAVGQRQIRQAILG